MGEKSAYVREKSNAFKILVWIILLVFAVCVSTYLVSEFSKSFSLGHNSEAKWRIVQMSL